MNAGMMAERACTISLRLILTAARQFRSSGSTGTG